jgi:hypothetical protein
MVAGAACSEGASVALAINRSHGVYGLIKRSQGFRAGTELTRLQQGCFELEQILKYMPFKGGGSHSLVKKQPVPLIAKATNRRLISCNSALACVITAACLVLFLKHHTAVPHS